MVDIDKIVQINIKGTEENMQGFVEFVKDEIGVPTFLCEKDEIYYNVGVEKLRESETELYLKILSSMYEETFRD